MTSYDYDDAHDSKYAEPFEVPILVANSDTLKKFGRTVEDFDKEEVWITTWPQLGSRPICPGTGNEGGVASGEYCFKWEGDLLKGKNHAVGREYVTGRLPAGMDTSKRTHVLVRDLNYHPDGGQVFFPQDKTAFVLLLALPGDEIKLEDFVAFYCDGTFGVQIKAGIWHQAAYPIRNEAVFKNKQGKVHACVVVDTAIEFGRYLKVPLQI